jgi:hypothetical protein
LALAERGRLAALRARALVLGLLELPRVDGRERVALAGEAALDAGMSALAVVSTHDLAV